MGTIEKTTTTGEIETKINAILIKVTRLHAIALELEIVHERIKVTPPLVTESPTSVEEPVSNILDKLDRLNNKFCAAEERLKSATKALQQAI